MAYLYSLDVILVFMGLSETVRPSPLLSGVNETPRPPSEQSGSKNPTFANFFSSERFM